MKIMIDSNVLVSAVYNPSSKPANTVRDVCENHGSLLCDHIVAECYDVIRLSALLPPDIVLVVPDTIMNDLRAFLAKVEDAGKYDRVAAAYGLSDAIALN